MNDEISDRELEKRRRERRRKNAKRDKRKANIRDIRPGKFESSKNWRNWQDEDAYLDDEG